MGCVCSRRTDEVGGFSVSSWTCCFRSCCFLGTCVVNSGKHESSPSVYNSTSIPQGGNISSSLHHHQISRVPSELNICNEHRVDIKIMDTEHTKDQDPLKEKDASLDGKSKVCWNVEPTSAVQDDKDSCPICLEGYDLENPSLDTLCEHNFHLACILEWMERSDNCPMCDKEMVFNENG